MVRRFENPGLAPWATSFRPAGAEARKEQRMRAYWIGLAAAVVGSFAANAQAATDAGDSIMSGAIRGAIVGAVIGGIVGVVVWALRKKK